ncbi:hypothetical protein E4U42_002265 [Claviceps africana]|uniref:Methyltransferase n=1 Tax=Claviceps africana TaxID=83212 RepID=A0A8K0JAY6_9HYPO|nr:hypothetical protein E4U42_002265 [Claviceps africana]
METTPPPPRGDVVIPINFYDDPADGSTPFNYVAAPPKGLPQRNFRLVAHDTLLTDIRGRESDFSLEHDAFQVIVDLPPTPDSVFADDDTIRARYYPEVEQLLLESVPGATRIAIFDHTLRRAGTIGGPDAGNPIARAHIDHTGWAAEKRLRQRIPSEAEADALLRGRWRIVNVWRPLTKAPLEDVPLCFASASTGTLGAEDLCAVESRFPDGYLGQTYIVRHGPAQKWYYLSGMTGNERLVLGIYDSNCTKTKLTVTGGAPHTAFVDPRARPGAEARESIEIRALVFGP